MVHTFLPVNFGLRLAVLKFSASFLVFDFIEQYGTKYILDEVKVVFWYRSLNIIGIALKQINKSNTGKTRILRWLLANAFFTQRLTLF